MEAKRKKILFFVKNIAMLETIILKLNPYLHDCDILVFHNSRMQPGRKHTEARVDNIDVSCLSYSEIKHILKEWSPDICVLYNFRGIIDQFFIRLCKASDIKIYFLAHGILSDDVSTYKKISSRGLWLRVKRLACQLRQYSSLICHSDSRMGELRIFHGIFFKNKFNLNPFDKYFVYGERDLNSLSRFYELRRDENAFIVGFPIFESEEQKKLFTGSEGKEGGMGVLYVHQPFILDNYAKISYEEERTFLLNLANNLIPAYGRFTIMLHPRDDVRRYELLYEGTKVRVIQSPNDYKAYAGADLVVGHYSTALLYGLYFDIPTILIDYPTMKANDLFKSIFQSFESVQDALKAEIHVNKEAKLYMLGEHNTYQYIANCIEHF